MEWNYLKIASVASKRARANLKSEIKSTYFGFLWWIVEPLMYMGAFYLIFGILLGKGDSNYVVFLLAGLVPWKWFGSCVATGAVSITQSRGIIGLIYVPKLLFPTITVIESTIKFVAVLLVFFVLLVSMKHELGWWVLHIPIILFIQLVFITASTWLLALMAPFFPDMRLILPNLLQFMFFLSAIFYSPDRFPEPWNQLFYLNPMVTLIESYRQVLIDKVAPDYVMLYVLLAVCTTVCLLTASLYQRLDRQIAKRLT